MGGKTKQQQQQKVEALPSAAQQLQTQMRAVLQSFVGSLPKDQRDEFLSEFPAVSNKKSGARGDSDPLKKVSEECNEAFKDFKRLAEKKRKIEQRATKLQEQLEKLSEDLARTTQELEEAQHRHERELRSYASVVQQGAGAAGCQVPMSEDGDITGDEDELEQAEGDATMGSGPAAAAAAAAASHAAPGTPEPAQAETEEFKKFKESLSGEQRAVLERQLQAASHDTGKPVEAQKLMDTAKLMARFVQALQTESGG